MGELMNTFNTDQLTNEALGKEVASATKTSFMECSHWFESRKDLHSDLHGYIQKIQTAENCYLFLKACEECAVRLAEDDKFGAAVVARNKLSLLSIFTTKALLKAGA